MDQEYTVRRGNTAVHATSRLSLDGVADIQPEFTAAGMRQEAISGLGEGGVEVHTADIGGLRLERELYTEPEPPGRTAVRLCLHNERDTDVPVDMMTPLWAGPDGVDLDGRPAGDWILVRQPRYKNDMPASVRLGSCDPGVWDAVRGTQETGGFAPAPGTGDWPRAFSSSELTLLRAGDAGMMVGLLPVDRQLVRCRLELDEERRRLESFRVDCLCDGQLLRPGGTLRSQWVVVDLNADLFAAVEAYVQALAAAAGGARPGCSDIPSRPLVWCSWYYYANAFTQAEAEANLEALERQPLPFDVFQLDECWDLAFGDWYPNADWPDLPGFAARCRAAGYIPGLWTCGFLVEPRARTGFHHPEWLLRRRSGERVQFNMAGMSNHVLDTTHPGALEFIEQLYRRLTREYGFTYHKVDFTRAVVYDPEAVFHDRTMNRAQAYRAGIEAIRRGIGVDSYLNICGGLYGPLIGIADAQRTGSDVKSIWPSLPSSEDTTDYGPFTIKQNSLRYWMNALWDNDPDALMVRRRTEPYRDQSLSLGLMNDDEALTSTLNQYIGGGLVCTTENLTEIEADRLLLLRHCAPSVGTAAVPRDLLEGGRFPAIFDTRVRPRAAGLPEWHTVGVVNWSRQNRWFPLILNAALIGAMADTAQRFLVCAFRGGWTQVLQPDDRLNIGPVPPHGCEVVKIQPFQAEQPCLVRTDGHFSMGGTEVTTWNPVSGGVRLTVEWPWPVPLTLFVRPPAGRTFIGQDEKDTLAVEVPEYSSGLQLELAYR